MKQLAEATAGVNDMPNEPELMPGSWYTFNPPITALAMPTGGSNVCEPTECRFSRGWLIRKNERENVFFGKPLDDSRIISIPRILENFGNVTDCFRICYFLVPANAEATIRPDENQKA
jgi:hypothetical protein